IAMAILSFVPTPSALETRIGSLNFFGSSAKSAPKLPMPPRTPLVKVRVARWRMRCFASSATAMLTPASAYFMACNPFPGDLNFDTASIGRASGGGQWNGTSENVKQTPPTNSAGMEDSVYVRREACAEIPRLPRAFRRFDRHVDDNRRSNDVLARHTAPEARVERILPVVAHREVTLWRNFVGENLFFSGEFAFVRAGRRRATCADGVVLFEALAVNPDRAFANINNVSGHTDDAFHIVRLIGIERRLENNNLLPLRIAPQRNVNI